MDGDMDTGSVGRDSAINIEARPLARQRLEAARPPNGKIRRRMRLAPKLPAIKRNIREASK